MTPGRYARLVVLTACLVELGCGRHQRNEDFIPPEASAREALDACLRSWTQDDPVRGEGAQTIPNTRPQVLFADPRRTKKRALSGYVILGPVPGEAPRCFAVQLTFKEPTDEARERYVVIGRDPLWVCRYEEYLMVTHWEHAMPTDAKTAEPKK